MVEKLSKKTKSTPYVKCTITNELAESLNTLEEKIGIVRADVVRAALHEHIQNHYSAYLPKSKSEIMNEVKQKYYFEKYNKEFRNLESMKEQIPILEEHKKKLQSLFFFLEYQIHYNHKTRLDLKNFSIIPK